VLMPDGASFTASLAGALAAQGDNAGAAQEYRKVLDAKPDYVAARLALADTLVKTNDRAGALEQLREAVKQDSHDPALFERIGDLEAAQQHAAEARMAYQTALDLKPERSMRKSIQNKVSNLGK